MNTTTRRLLLIAAFGLVLALGFGLARWTAAPEASSASATQEGDAHADDHSGEATEGHDDHGDEGGEGEEAHEDEHGEEGVIALTPEQLAASGIELVAVGRGGGSEIRLSGRVEAAIGGRAAVATSVAGRVERVLVAPGDRVAANAPLAILVSGEAATMRASVDAARAEADAARRVHARDQALLEQGIVSRQDMEASQARSLAADATARAAAAQLQTAGSPDASGRVTIASPLAGIVGSVGVAPGGVVVAGALIAQVTDPAQTELVFNASPAAAAQITAGMPMQVQGPRGSFKATVVGVAADISESGGATLVRATGAAADLPPAGSPVAGVVVVSAQSGTATVPADAVQTVEGRSVVFVASDAGFRATPVLAGRRAGGRIEVLSGLSGNERIAGVNAFLLKAELAKGEAGDDD